MNKKIVVTGATKGIGRATAEKFAKEGWDLALCSRSEKDLDKLKSTFNSNNQKIIVQQCDVSDKEQLKKFAGNIRREFGAVDVLVNNAGIFIPGKVINEKEGTLEKLMSVNLFSAYHLTRMLLPEMRKKNSGHIFNLCSVASIKAYPNGGSYSITKFALLGLSKALREELKPHHIKVTSVISGAAYTNSWKGTEHSEERFMKAEDVAQVIWDATQLSLSAVTEEIILRPMLGDI